MKIQCIWACALLIAPTASGVAADKPVGQTQYETSCMSCHGAKGRGDGWLAAHLKSKVPSLTRLKRNNGGVFPFDSVYQVIDGRKEVLLHGPRQMPVWGAVYRVDSEKHYDVQSGQYVADEGATRARILALIEYISRLQE